MPDSEPEPESPDPETQSAESQSAETQSAETQSAETQSAETQSAETQPAVVPREGDATEETQEVDSDAIPVISGDWSTEERFEAFRAWLEAGGPRYEVWAKDCIFLEACPPVLRLEFPKGFRAKHVSATNRDKRLLKGVAAFFEGCTSVEVRNRADGSDRMTHRETVAHDAAMAQKALEQRIAEDADVAAIAAHFDAAIRSVHKDYRSPTPPVLAPEEA